MKQSIGLLMLLGLAVGVLCIAYALAPTATVLGGWTGAAVWLWWGVSRKIDNPSPPPPAAPLENENTQFSVVEDEDNPHHSIVVWHNEGTRK